MFIPRNGGPLGGRKWKRRAGRSPVHIHWSLGTTACAAEPHGKLGRRTGEHLQVSSTRDGGLLVALAADQPCPAVERKEAETETL